MHLNTKTLISNKSNIKPKYDYVNPCVNFANVSNVSNLNLRGFSLQENDQFIKRTENQRDLDRYF